MAKRLMEIANGVAEALAEHGATVSLFPEFSLKDVKDLKVVVVPLGIDRHRLSRSHREDDYKVQVGILKRATEDDLEDLIGFSEDLAVRFLDSSVCGLRCTKVSHEPLYVPDHLRERRQFTSVLELTFAGVARV